MDRHHEPDRAPGGLLIWHWCAPRPIRSPDGTYKIFGTKIFITWGEHDMAENIVHLVLACGGCARGRQGHQSVVVPKFMVNQDGSLGARNDVHCVSIEHKMGIKASPTAVLQFGRPWRRRGLPGGPGKPRPGYMFIMMNAARYAVGIQGIAIAERAYQKAVQYARDRVQSRPVDGSVAASAAIIHHPDVRRMLMTMRATTEACRAMASTSAAVTTPRTTTPDAQVRKTTPGSTNSWCRWSGLQHRDEPGSHQPGRAGAWRHGLHRGNRRRQYYRDAKILTIYEGTTAIQANDLVGPQDTRDGGTSGPRHCRADRKDRGGQSRQRHARAAGRGLLAWRQRGGLLDVVDFAGSTKAAQRVYAGSVPYLMLAGNLVAGWQMGRALLVAQRCCKGTGRGLHAGQNRHGQFYAEHILVQGAGPARRHRRGWRDSVTACHWTCLSPDPGA